MHRHTHTHKLAIHAQLIALSYIGWGAYCIHDPHQSHIALGFRWMSPNIKELRNIAKLPSCAMCECVLLKHGSTMRAYTHNWYICVSHYQLPREHASCIFGSEQIYINQCSSSPTKPTANTQTMLHCLATLKYPISFFCCTLFPFLLLHRFSHPLLRSHSVCLGRRRRCHTCGDCRWGLFFPPGSYYERDCHR